MPQIGGKFVCVACSISATKTRMNFKFSMGPKHTEMFKNLKCQRKMITITSAIVTKLKSIVIILVHHIRSVFGLRLAFVYERSIETTYDIVTTDES